MVKTVDIPCVGYNVKADVYEATEPKALLLSLIGRTSRRTKSRYPELYRRLADELGITTVIFDYSGHGDSPFNLEAMMPAQHFIEAITVFDWLKTNYPTRRIIVIGSSYGGFLATQLTKYRAFDMLILRAPAIYRPEDFYTTKKNEDRAATETLRTDKAALHSHPLLKRAATFKGETLLIVHENDEQIPKETTDAYARALRAEVVVVPGMPHSLDDASQAQIAAYNQLIFDWLSRHL